MIELDFHEIDNVELRCMTTIQFVPSRIITGFNDTNGLFSDGYVFPHRFATELFEITKPYVKMIDNIDMSCCTYNTNNYNIHVEHTEVTTTNRSVTITVYDNTGLIECIEISEPAFYQLCMIFHMAMRCIQYSDNFNHYWDKNEYSNFRN